MKKPELTEVGWLGPKDEMDRASHRFGKCSECHEIICVEKAMTDTQNTQPETNEMLHKAFRSHVELKHSEDARPSAVRIVRAATTPREDKERERNTSRSPAIQGSDGGRAQGEIARNAETDETLDDYGKKVGS
jgi:hypothetical protein